MSRRRARFQRTATLLLAAACALLVIAVILFPDKAFQASLDGLHIWWKFVFPALLPFLVAFELLLGFGVIHAAGVLLGPVMRSLFRLPASSGWALAAGFTAGYPAGAEAVARMRESGAVSRSQGERLLSLCYAASPMFIVAAVAVGFFGSARFGFVVAVVHYVAALAAGLIAGRLLHRPEEDGPGDGRLRTGGMLSLAAQCHKAMANARLADGRTFGKLLGDSVSSSVHTLMMLGGYMMIFSMLLNVISLAGIAAWLQSLTVWLFRPFGMPAGLAEGLTAGLLEAGIGAFAVSSGASAPAVWQAAAVGLILAWSGAAMLLQVKARLHGTDLRFSVFLLSRVVHGVLAFWLTFLLWEPLHRLPPITGLLPAYMQTFAEESARASSLWPLLPELALWALLAAALLGALLLSAAGLGRRSGPARK